VELVKLVPWGLSIGDNEGDPEKDVLELEVVGLDIFKEK